MKNKKDAWKSKEPLILKDTRIYYGNITNNMVLVAKDINNVMEEAFDKNAPGQVWKKGNVNSFGYFTLKNTLSNKVLTAVSEDNLAVGMFNHGLV